MRPGSYCIWSAGHCQAPMACTDRDCFLFANSFVKDFTLSGFSGIGMAKVQLDYTI